MTAPKQHALLDARAISVSLGGAPVLRRVSLQLQPGAWAAIVGPNGAGKSTLLRVLAGLLSPDEGEVSLMGRDVRHWSARERGQRLAWLPQQSGDAAGDLSVRDVVQLGRMPHLGLFGAPDARDQAVVDAAMRQTECGAWAARRMSVLSGGERQRALLARALAVQAPLLLLDEPTTHLDAPHQVALVRLLQQLARDGMAVVSVLHDLSLALQADRLIVMAAGEIRAEGGCDDPTVHAALTDVFGGALRIERLRDQWVAVPALGAR